MSGFISESTSETPLIREAAQALLDALDGPPSRIVTPEVKDCANTLRASLAAEQARFFKRIPDALWAAEGLRLMSGGLPVQRRHVTAIAEAAKWAIGAQDLFDERQASDMRALMMWRAEHPGHEGFPARIDLVRWLLDRSVDRSDQEVTVQVKADMAEVRWMAESLTEARKLLVENAELFRYYETSHRAKVKRFIASGARDPDSEYAVDAARRKAERNESQARKIEDYLGKPVPDPRDKLDEHIATTPHDDCPDCQAMEAGPPSEDKPAIFIRLDQFKAIHQAIVTHQPIAREVCDQLRESFDLIRPGDRILVGEKVEIARTQPPPRTRDVVMRFHELHLSEKCDVLTAIGIDPAPLRHKFPEEIEREGERWTRLLLAAREAGKIIQLNAEIEKIIGPGTKRDGEKRRDVIKRAIRKAWGDGNPTDDAAIADLVHEHAPGWSFQVFRADRDGKAVCPSIELIAYAPDEPL